MTSVIRTYYRVAEHLFAVEYTHAALASLLTNYEPFSVSHLSTEQPIFLLRIELNGLICEAQRNMYTHIFSDISDEDMPRIEVYQNPYTWLFRVSQVANSPICCELQCNKDFTQAVLHIASQDNDLRFCIDNALMLMYAFRTVPLMTLEMHAAVVIKNSNTRHPISEQTAYVFLGHSGTGKSTHAQQWLEAFPDACLLNDDNPILRVMDNGEVRIYGSPWSGKTPCYKNAHARVAGIIKLSQAPHNKAKHISLPEAYANILSSASGLKINKYMADGIYNTIKHIITHIHCYHLECLPNTDAAKLCFDYSKEYEEKQ